MEPSIARRKARELQIDETQVVCEYREVISPAAFRENIGIEELKTQSLGYLEIIPLTPPSLPICEGA